MLHYHLIYGHLSAYNNMLTARVRFWLFSVLLLWSAFFIGFHIWKSVSAGTGLQGERLGDHSPPEFDDGPFIVETSLTAGNVVIFRTSHELLKTSIIVQRHVHVINEKPGTFWPHFICFSSVQIFRHSNLTFNLRWQQEFSHR